MLSAKAMGSVIRPGSESLAEVHVGIQGTCEGLNLPEESRNGMNPSEQSSRLTARLSRSCESETTERIRVPVLKLAARV